MAVVAIVGTGLIGRAWAISFARAGHEVRLYDEAAGAAEKAIAFAREMAKPLETEGLLDGQTADQLVARMKPAPDLAAALAGAAHVQENTPEDVAVKQKVFAALDASAAPETVLASSTSAILPSKFTETLKDGPSGWSNCNFVEYSGEKKIWERPMAVGFPFLSRQSSQEKNKVFFTKYDTKGGSLLVGDFPLRSR